MRTKLLMKGRVVSPKLLRRKLGLRSGDPLDIKIEGNSIVLTPRRSRLKKYKIIMDSMTGLPALTAGRDATVFTSEHVDEIVSNFPSKPFGRSWRFLHSR